MIGRLISKLHDRVSTSHLKNSTLSDSTLDDLLSASSSIAEAMDDLTVSLYGPQDSAVATERVRNLQSVAHSLRNILFFSLGLPVSVSAASLEDLLSSLSLETSVQASRDIKWLFACFGQIDKSIAGLL
jgi:hypothetical protein